MQKARAALHPSLLLPPPPLPPPPLVSIREIMMPSGARNAATCRAEAAWHGSKVMEQTWVRKLRQSRQQPGCAVLHFALKPLDQLPVCRLLLNQRNAVRCQPASQPASLLPTHTPHCLPCHAGCAGPRHPWWPPAPGSAPGSTAGRLHQRPARGSSRCCSMPPCRAQWRHRAGETRRGRALDGAVLSAPGCMAWLVVLPSLQRMFYTGA